MAKIILFDKGLHYIQERNNFIGNEPSIEEAYVEEIIRHMKEEADRKVEEYNRKRKKKK